MKMQRTSNFLVRTAGLAIATASLLVTLPALANEQQTTPTVKKVAAAPTGNIVQVAVANGSFKTLVAAVKASGLVDTLSGKGPFTVFAPTDEAFAKLPKGTVETLLKPENKAILVKVLTYHVVSGKVYAKDIKAGSALVPTVEGSSIKVTKGKNVVIDNAKVIAADVKTSNGVIHVIDTVLLPPDL
ncbi:MAG: fasciclin [Pseudanabaena frigida]|uniref:Fasciclin n=1 Tax=Pseudanabaena frigida TaxID=945775 RepID=A0A2W4Y1F4_9CYAN|nr:MAG: fasciclin [Pseudanabaena frigida]